MCLHGDAVGSAAHRRSVEHDRPSALRRLGDLRRNDLCARRHDELDGVLEGLAWAREEDVGGTGADVDRENALRGPPVGSAAVGRCAVHAGLWTGALLKRSFQTFFIASITMSLHIFDSPTWRSTKMMGSSTILKPSWWAR